MKKVTLFLTLIVFAFSVSFGQKSDEKKENSSKEVTVKTKDGITLFADVYLSKKGKSAPLIMLFHQGGGDARGEYASLIPKLQKKKYNIIAVDLRTGGNVFEGVNRTVEKLGDKKYGYCDAYPDLEATLEYARSNNFTGKKIAWGSSFSAALVFQLAAEKGKDLAGVLAFSPASGGPMADCKPELFVSKVKIPVLALRPGSEMERESAQMQFKMFKENNIQTYVSENGVHGSSMLNSERVEGSVDAHWKIVLTFIKEILE